MTSTIPPNSERFRYREFISNWVEPLLRRMSVRSSVHQDPSSVRPWIGPSFAFSRALLLEAEVWTKLADDAGYFPKAAQLPGAAALRPETELEELISAIHLDLPVDPLTFQRAITTSRAELTDQRSVLLDMVVFANRDEFEALVAGAESSIDEYWLHPGEIGIPSALDAILCLDDEDWSEKDFASDDTMSRDTESGWPSWWREGPLISLSPDASRSTGVVGV